MSRRPGTRRQTQGKATGGRAATKDRTPTAAVLVRRAFSNRHFHGRHFRDGHSRGWHRPNGHSHGHFPAHSPGRHLPARGLADTSPDKKSDSSHKGKNRFFIRPGAIGTNRRDKGQAPGQGGDSPAPADGYSYCPDLRRSTSSRVRKRQAPRLRFFFVRPA